MKQQNSNTSEIKSKLIFDLNSELEQFKDMMTDEVVGKIIDYITEKNNIPLKVPPFLNEVIMAESFREGLAREFKKLEIEQLNIISNNFVKVRDFCADLKNHGLYSWWQILPQETQLILCYIFPHASQLLEYTKNLHSLLKEVNESDLTNYFDERELLLYDNNYKQVECLDAKIKDCSTDDVKNMINQITTLQDQKHQLIKAWPGNFSVRDGVDRIFQEMPNLLQQTSGGYIIDIGENAKDILSLILHKSENWKMKIICLQDNMLSLCQEIYLKNQLPTELVVSFTNAIQTKDLESFVKGISLIAQLKISNTEQEKTLSQLTLNKEEQLLQEYKIEKQKSALELLEYIFIKAFNGEKIISDQALRSKLDKLEDASLIEAFACIACDLESILSENINRLKSARFKSPSHDDAKYDTQDLHDLNQIPNGNKDFVVGEKILLAQLRPHNIELYYEPLELEQS